VFAPKASYWGGKKEGQQKSVGVHRVVLWGKGIQQHWEGGGRKVHVSWYYGTEKNAKKSHRRLGVVKRKIGSGKPSCLLVLFQRVPQNRRGKGDQRALNLPRSRRGRGREERLLDPVKRLGLMPFSAKALITSSGEPCPSA